MVGNFYLGLYESVILIILILSKKNTIFYDVIFLT